MSWDEELHELFDQSQNDPEAIDNMVDAIADIETRRARSSDTFHNLEKILDRPDKHKHRSRDPRRANGGAQWKPEAS